MLCSKPIFAIFSTAHRGGRQRAQCTGEHVHSLPAKRAKGGGGGGGGEGGEGVAEAGAVEALF